MAGRWKRCAWLAACLALTVVSAAAIIRFSGQDSGQSQSLSHELTAWVLGLLPVENTAENLKLLNYFLRKLAHFGLYFLLGIGLTGMVRRQNRLRTVLVVLVLCGLFAAGDEFHQGFSQGRTPSGWDVLLDTCGACAGWAALECLMFLREKRRLKH